MERSRRDRGGSRRFACGWRWRRASSWPGSRDASSAPFPTRPRWSSRVGPRSPDLLDVTAVRAQDRRRAGWMPSGPAAGPAPSRPRRRLPSAAHPGRRLGRPRAATPKPPSGAGVAGDGAAPNADAPPPRRRPRPATTGNPLVRSRCRCRPSRLPAEPAPAPSPRRPAPRRRRSPRRRPPTPSTSPTALRLADDQNPEIAEARVAIMAASAQQLAAYSILLPSLNAGPTYHAHTGNLIRSTGQVLNVSSQSLYVGAGARTVAAETVNIPGVNLIGALTDAIYQPLAARQNVAGAAIQRRGDRQRGAPRGLRPLPGADRRPGDAPGVARVGGRGRRDRPGRRRLLRHRPRPQGRRRPRRDGSGRLFQAEILHAEELVAVVLGPALRAN